MQRKDLTDQWIDQRIDIPTNLFSMQFLFFLLRNFLFFLLFIRLKYFLLGLYINYYLYYFLYYYFYYISFYFYFSVLSVTNCFHLFSSVLICFQSSWRRFDFISLILKSFDFFLFVYQWIVWFVQRTLSWLDHNFRPATFIRIDIRKPCWKNLWIVVRPEIDLQHSPASWRRTPSFSRPFDLFIKQIKTSWTNTASMMFSRNHQINRPDGCTIWTNVVKRPVSYHFFVCHRVWHWCCKKTKTKIKTKKCQKIWQIFFCVYNYIVKLKIWRFYSLQKPNMETKIKCCETLRNKSKSLRVDYCKEPDIFKRSEILRKRKRTIEKMMKVQSEISKLLLDELSKND